MSRLFAKTTNYKKHIFEVIEECAHGTAVMLKMCSRFDSKLRLEQLIVHVLPKTTLRQVFIQIHKMCLISEMHSDSVLRHAL